MRSGLRLTFFLINFTVAVLFVLFGAIVSISGDRSPFAVIGAFSFIWPAAAFAVAEVVLFRSGSRSLERTLGATCGLIGAFSFLAMVGSTLLAVVSRWTLGIQFWTSFGGICLTIATYGFWCCWWRAHVAERIQSRGFPVGPPTGQMRVEAIED